MEGVVAREPGLQRVEVVTEGFVRLPQDHPHHQPPPGQHLAHREAQGILQAVRSEHRGQRRIAVEVVDGDARIHVNRALLVLLDDLYLLGEDAEAPRALPLSCLLGIQDRHHEPAPGFGGVFAQQIDDPARGRRQGTQRVAEKIGDMDLLRDPPEYVPRHRGDRVCLVPRKIQTNEPAGAVRQEEREAQRREKSQRYFTRSAPHCFPYRYRRTSSTFVVR